MRNALMMQEIKDQEKIHHEQSYQEVSLNSIYIQHLFSTVQFFSMTSIKQERI